MNAPPLRLLDQTEQEPALNMALDEALLWSEHPATLRLYGWRPHAVSLGYFQRRADFDDLPAGTVVVRRLTGGGAIHHGDELTFSLALDARLLPTDIDAGYALLHDAAVLALADIGCGATRLDAGHAPGARPRERWCFAVPGRNDIVDAAGRKLVGSAQRRTRAGDRPRVLHHGSIVLERAGLTPFTAAVADALPAAGATGALRRSLARRLAAALDHELVTGTPDAGELAMAARLRTERYRSAAFTAAR